MNLAIVYYAFSSCVTQQPIQFAFDLFYLFIMCGKDWVNYGIFYESRWAQCCMRQYSMHQSIDGSTLCTKIEPIPCIRCTFRMNSSTRLYNTSMQQKTIAIIHVAHYYHDNGCSTDNRMRPKIIHLNLCCVYYFNCKY